MSQIWYHGSNKKIDELKVDGSALNLWGSKGAYLSSERDSALKFGDIITEFKITSEKILNTDSEVDYELSKKAMEFAKIPFMFFFNANVETYADLLSLMGDYTGGDRRTAVEWLQKELGFDALLTNDVSAKKDGQNFSEGDVLVVLNPNIAKPVIKRKTSLKP